MKREKERERERERESQTNYDCRVESRGEGKASGTRLVEECHAYNLARKTIR